jgi:hypothetical protein
MEKLGFGIQEKHPGSTKLNFLIKKLQYIYFHASMKNSKLPEEASSSSNLKFFHFSVSYLPSWIWVQLRFEFETLINSFDYLRLSPFRRGQEYEICDAEFGTGAESPSPCPPFELTFFGIFHTIQR